MSQQCHVSEVLQRYAPPVSSDQDGQISYTEFLGATLNLDEARPRCDSNILGTLDGMGICDLGEIGMIILGKFL